MTEVAKSIDEFTQQPIPSRPRGDENPEQVLRRSAANLARFALLNMTGDLRERALEASKAIAHLCDFFDKPGGE